MCLRGQLGGAPVGCLLCVVHLLPHSLAPVTHLLG
jgi:hypothetical protein